MRSVIDWLKTVPLGMTWALVGKGPSFSRRKEAASRLQQCKVLCLNHACLFIECDVVHFTDYDAFQECADHLADKPTMVVMPWHPHTNNKPGRLSLNSLTAKDRHLARLYESGKILTYNSTLCKDRKDSLPTIHVRFFSAVVGVSILGVAGIKDVRTLGIDGGNDYAVCFDRKNLLLNGRPSFDIQFREMKRLAKRYKMKIRPIMESV